MFLRRYQQKDCTSLLIHSGSEGFWSKFINEQACRSIEITEIQKQNVLHKLHKLHKNVVAIIYNRGTNNAYYGTGTLISEDIVLTCAHNLFSRTGFELPLSLFQIFTVMKESPAVSYRIQKCYIPNEYNKQLKLDDYALIKLTQKVKNSGDFLPINTNFTNKHKHAAIFGFPLSKYNIDSGSLPQSLWGASVKDPFVEIHECDRLLYNIPTEPGHSGSAIIEINQDSNEYNIIGVHNASYTKRISKQESIKLNLGTLLSANKIDKLKNWVQQQGAAMFQIHTQREIPKDQQKILMQPQLNQLDSHKVQTVAKLFEGCQAPKQEQLKKIKKQSTNDQNVRDEFWCKPENLTKTVPIHIQIQMNSTIQSISTTNHKEKQCFCNHAQMEKCYFRRITKHSSRPDFQFSQDNTKK